MPDQTTQTTTTTTAPPATQTTSAPTAPADWTTGFNDEIKGFVQNKGWKAANEVVDSYRNLEKLHGVPQDRILKLPESMESAEAQAIWERLGKPKEAKGYELKPTEKNGDPKLVEWAAELFHKSNMTTTQAQAVMKAWNERQDQIRTQTEANEKASIAQADTELKQKWGAAYEKNKNLINEAARVAEISTQEAEGLMRALGPTKAAELLVKVGNSVGEAKFVTGRPAGDGVVTPDQAQAEIKDLQRDAGFRQKYLSGDFDAKKRMEGLMKMAYPGELHLT